MYSVYHKQYQRIEIENPNNVQYAFVISPESVNIETMETSKLICRRQTENVKALIETKFIFDRANVMYA